MTRRSCWEAQRNLEENLFMIANDMRKALESTNGGYAASYMELAEVAAGCVAFWRARVG